MNRRARVWQRLTPPRLAAQIEQADRQLLDAQKTFAKVADRDQRVTVVAQELNADRIRNGYAERIAHALGGKYRWTT